MVKNQSDIFRPPYNLSAYYPSDGWKKRKFGASRPNLLLSRHH